MIHSARDLLLEARVRLAGDCRRALEAAMERSRRTGEGSERMAAIAGQARWTPIDFWIILQ